jgi:hypothetical protein
MKKIAVMTGILLACCACDSMDDNYKDYLYNVQQYSPSVRNLTHVDALGTVELFWENPPGNLAVKIKIDWEAGADTINEMIEYYKLENLEIRGYDISVYTIDRYGNLSVPVTVSAFPGNSE